ncbi:MAG: DUF166 family protein [Promethearchaeia archaeon]
MKILILSDGKYGDRAAEIIKQKFPKTKLIVLKEEDPSIFLDEVELDDYVEEEIQNADLLITYVRHPDIVAEICERKKPTIIPINFGEGFLRQVREINPKIVMPIAMCNAFPDTGIKEIDDYFMKFGNPTFKIDLDYKKNGVPIIKDAKLIIESPCGASRKGLDVIKGKEVNPDNLNEFALTIRQECREPVSILLSHNDIGESSASLHLINLLNAIEKEDPLIFNPKTHLGDYAAKRRMEYKTKKIKLFL